MLRFILLLIPLLSVGCSLSAGKRIEVDPAHNKIIKSGKDTNPYRIRKHSKPAFLNLDEIIKIAEAPETSKSEFEAFWTQPIIDNQHFYRYGQPKPQSSDALGSLVRVATWNIEKSHNVTEVVEALESEKAYIAMLDKKLSKKQRALALRQRQRLKEADVLILQEMDIGHCRSGYRNNAEYIAKKLNYNYTYGVTQLEISPEYLVGFGPKNSKYHCAKCAVNDTHKTQYKGLFGIAVLSKYPIKDVKFKQLETQVYDWYAGESEPPDLLEKGRRASSELLFKHEYSRELKLGGRSYMQVDLHIPQLPLETLSIINVHLEIKTSPEQRHRQIKEILGYIKPIKNPVIMAGDFNSSPHNLAPTSAPKAAKKLTTSPSSLLSAGLSLSNVTTGVTQTRNFLNFYKNYRNPLASHVFAVSPNHQNAMFRTIRDFRFDDGGAFDFRGDKESSLGKAGVLSNSNQRHWKGFKFTFKVRRPIAFWGYEKLDWMFVKGLLTESNEKNGSKRLAPHYGEVLNAFNRGSKKNFSDHSPMVIDLPIF